MTINIRRIFKIVTLTILSVIVTVSVINTGYDIYNANNKLSMYHDTLNELEDRAEICMRGGVILEVYKGGSLHYFRCIYDQSSSADRKSPSKKKEYNI